MIAPQPWVLDASAVLAFLLDEPGANQVRDVIVGAIVSSLNWSEVVQKSLSRNADIDAVMSELETLQVSVVAFDEADAVSAARMWLHERARRISLADRACLSLAQDLGAAALTADRAWADLNIPVEIRLIRGSDDS